MAESVRTADLCPVQWATSTTTREPRQDGHEHGRERKAPRARTEAKEATAASSDGNDPGTELQVPDSVEHELDSFA